mmetsp:Transcript_6762/g.19159  ORF Transcript_6762/g.19159 Transcript_6762/m.19159 type:complete len:276 (-) Transcript_6762:2156-2983(-)
MVPPRPLECPAPKSSTRSLCREKRELQKPPMTRRCPKASSGIPSAMPLRTLAHPASRSLRSAPLQRAPSSAKVQSDARRMGSPPKQTLQFPLQLPNPTSRLHLIGCRASRGSAAKKATCPSRHAPAAPVATSSLRISKSAREQRPEPPPKRAAARPPADGPTGTQDVRGGPRLTRLHLHRPLPPSAAKARPPVGTREFPTRRAASGRRRATVGPRCWHTGPAVCAARPHVLQQRPPPRPSSRRSARAASARPPAARPPRRAPVHGAAEGAWHDAA